VKRSRWLITLGVLALLAFAVATLPAGIARGPLRKAGIDATGFGGSLWSGRAAGLTWRGAALGDASWNLRPAALLRGRVAGHAALARSDGSLETDFDVSFGGQDLRLAGARFELPLVVLEALPLGLPRGWRGQATGAIAELHLRQGWPETLRGTLDLDGLVAPPPRNVPVGSFHAEFPAPDPRASLSMPADPSNVTASVRDKSGPFSVDAQLTLNRARNFALEGTLQPRGPVPQAMERSLQLLGPADATGRRQFSVGGSL
jgi:general secretion pathway protein N